MRSTRGLRNPGPLLAIVAAAFAVRVLLIWVWRPEFAGWFNHTYYYFVQTRSVLEGAPMPYSDLPLVFWIYAGAARLLTAFGMEQNDAIVNSSRAIMSFVPAITAVPVYLILRKIGASDRNVVWKWLLVFAGAFVPLGVVHMPELLQKNVIGLFLFACLLLTARYLSEKLTIAGVAAAALLVVFITLSHFGTLAVCCLFGVAYATALIIRDGFNRRSCSAAAAVSGAAALAGGVLFVFAPNRLLRVLEYVSGSLSGSLLGKLVLEGTLADKALYAAGIILPAAVLLVLIMAYRTAWDSMGGPDKTFFLANVILLYLLAAPVIDTAIVPRLMLFLILPGIVTASYLLDHLKVRWIPASIVGALALASVVMMFGETMSVVMTNERNRSIRMELERLGRSGLVGPDSFIVTTYGVNPACNWFLDAKAGLITSFNKDILGSHGKVFVLSTDSVPDDDSPVDKNADGRLDDAERYAATRRSIALPEGSEPVFSSDSFELFEIRNIPSNWNFDSEGDWIGYRDANAGG